MKFIEQSRSFSAAQIFFEKPKSVRGSYIEQYRILHCHIFKSMQTIFNEISEKNDFSWLTDYCIPIDYLENCNYADYRLNYFNDSLLDLILKQFSNKYVVSDLQKQMIHLECFYDNFIDYLIQDSMKVVMNKKEKTPSINFDSNVKILKFISYLITSIGKNCSSNRFTRKDETKSLNYLLINTDLLVPYSSFSKVNELNVLENKHFWHKTCMVANKLAYFLSDHNRFYSILLENAQDNLSVIKEMQEIVFVFKITCDFIHKNLKPRMINLNEKEIESFFDASKLKESLVNVNDEIFFQSSYSTQAQYKTLLKCIEISIKNKFNRLFESSEQLYDESENADSKWFQSNSLGIARSQDGSVLPLISSSHTDNFISNNNDLQRLLNILLNEFPKQLEMCSTLFEHSFLVNYTTFESKNSIEKMITRLYLKYFLLKVLQIKNDTCTILTLSISDIKLHLNLFLHIKQFLVDNLLSNCTIFELVSHTYLENDNTQLKLKFKSLNEFFQPFLLEYIRIQEDQFIKYITKLTDADKLNEITMEIANLLSRRVSIIQINKGSSFIGV